MIKRMKVAGGPLTVAMVAVMATACGSVETGGDGGRGGGDAFKDPQAAALAWAKCMRDNGVEIPDPKPQDDGEGGDVTLAPGLGGPMPGMDAETFESAKKACAEHAEDMGGADAGGFTEEDKQRMVDFAKCMREHGVDMADPDFDGSDGEMGIEIKSDDPEFAAADEACNDLAGTTP